MASNRKSKVTKRRLGKVEAILACMASPEYMHELHEVMELVYLETHGTVAGFELLKEWAERGDEKVIPTGEALWEIWISYGNDCQRYFGMGRLIDVAAQSRARSAI
jgi:hypothetical protein